MAAPLLDELKRYVGFGDADEAALRRLHPVATPHFRAITDEFYRRLVEFPEAAEVLTSPEQTERLKVTLGVWLDRLLAGPWDDEYYQLRAQIGRVHVRVRLPQRFMLTAMSVIRQNLSDIARTQVTNPEPIVTALGKIVDIELSIMLETYRHDSLERVRRFEKMDRELLERRLELSETRYHELVENAGVMMVAVDAHDRILLFNRKAEEVTDYKRAEILGQHFLDTLCSDLDREIARGALDNARSGVAITGFDAALNTRTGDERRIRWRATHLVSPSGALACVIGLDITEELVLAERTERAERLAGLGTLAAGLAHEIRNPLNSAKLQLTLMERRLKRGGASSIDSALGSSHLVSEELSRLAGLVEEFLDFARPRTLRLIAADLCETARTVIQLLAPELDEKGVSVTSTLEGPVAARYDEERIKQVLLNLLRNGAEAAGKGGWVGLSIHRVGSKALIAISDSGSGPPPGADIFAPFTTSKEEGTGLGLPIVDRIVTAHGGAVSWRRDNGATVFTVELPLDGPVTPGT